jgi:hypothetical protein
VSSVERGERNVSLVNIVRIAKALEVDAGELVAGLAETIGDPRTAWEPSRVPRILVCVPDPPLITLDTSCVSALANPRDSDDPVEVEALDAIIELARSGAVHLQVTTAYDRDFERFKDAPGRQERLEWLAKAPQLASAPGVFRLDVSPLDGPDPLASDVQGALDTQLREILGPEAARTGNLSSHNIAKTMSDIDHLLGHARSGASAFATLDKSTILNKREKLVHLGLRVALPSEILADLKAS